MNALLSLGLGYLVGCISPAAWLGKKKHVNLKETGTKNLGATNTALVLGRKAGVFVMLFDILKSFFAAKLAKVLFPQLAIAGLIGSFGTMLGHCFPVTMHFRGGKGLAAFGGMVLAYEPWFFAAIVIPGVILMTLFNTGVVVPMLASVMFPLLTWFTSRSIPDTAMVVVSSLFIVYMHLDNLKKARDKKDVIPVKTFYKNILFRKREK